MGEVFGRISEQAPAYSVVRKATEYDVRHYTGCKPLATAAAAAAATSTQQSSKKAQGAQPGSRS